MRTRQPSDRIQDDHDVLAHLDPASGSLQAHLGDGHVPRRRVVETGRDHLSEANRLHFGHLFGTFIDEHDEQRALWIIRGNPLGHGLEYGGFAGLGRGNNEGPLAFSKGAKQVDHSICIIGLATIGAAAFQCELFVGMLGSELFELRTVTQRLGGVAVHRIQLGEGSALAVLRPLSHGATNLVPRPEAVLPNQPGTYVYIAFAGRVTGFSPTNERGAVAQDLQNAKTVCATHLNHHSGCYRRTAQTVENPLPLPGKAHVFQVLSKMSIGFADDLSAS